MYFWLFVGRKEGRKEGGKEGRREGRKEGRKEGGQEGRREGRKERRKEGGREGGKEGRREGRKEGGKEGRKEGIRNAVLQTTAQQTHATRKEVLILTWHTQHSMNRIKHSGHICTSRGTGHYQSIYCVICTKKTRINYS
jgi:hypothetical protein